MKNNRNVSEDILAKHRKVFLETVDVIYGTLGTNAFNRYLPDRQNWYKALNKAVFDAEMVAFSNFSFDLRTVDYEGLRDNIMELMGENEFIKTIASATSAPEKVKKRINMFSDCISKYGKER